MNDAEKIKALEDEIVKLKKSNQYLQSKNEEFENGDLSLYHAVQKKMKELSKILNKYKLDDIDIDDKNNKSFERISSILEKCEKYALSANALGARLGLNQEPTNEQQSTNTRKPTTPESMADAVGELAGMRQ